jgi:hypothetical protein
VAPQRYDKLLRKCDSGNDQPLKIKAHFLSRWRQLKRMRGVLVKWYRAS